MTSNDVRRHLSSSRSVEHETDRLDRLHSGRLTGRAKFYGLAVRLNLTGSYEFWGHTGVPPGDSIIVTTAGPQTLSHRGLKAVHERLAPLAKAYGAASSFERPSIRSEVAEELLHWSGDPERDWVDDISHLLAIRGADDDLLRLIPDRLTEAEVIRFVYSRCAQSIGYANREAVAAEALDRYIESDGEF
ncbi:hypothetical protein [Brevibacterium aurantiacum]|nr:hypothetical protein [Brevibacterium aurantiacum]